MLDLGTGVNEFSTDDTLASDSDDAVPTEQAVKAYVDEINIIGTANAEWKTFVPDVSRLNTGTGASFWHVTTGYHTNYSTGTSQINYVLPLETNKGGYKLYLKAFIIGILDADANNKITAVHIIGVNSGSAAYTLKDTDNTDHSTVGDKTFSGATFPAAVIDCSSHDHIQIQVNVITNTQYNLDLKLPRIEYYYG